MDLKEIREQINKLGTDMSELLKKARSENRDLTKEEGATFDKMDEDREALLVTERRFAKLEDLEKPGERRAAPTQPTGEPRGKGETRGGRPEQDDELQRAEAVRAWMLGGTTLRTAEHAAAAQRLGISLDQRQITLRLAPRAPRSTRSADLAEWEKRYLGVDVISPDNGGHFTVPNEMMRALETARLAFGGMLSVATVLRTGTGADLPIPTMNDTSNEGALIGESVQETAEVEPTLAQLVMQAFTYSSKKVFMSVEYIQDNAIDAVGRVGGILGERLGRIQNRHATTGSGSSQPNGIVTAAADSGVTAPSNSAISYDNIVDLEHSVDPAYRVGARFMFADATLKLLKKIKVPQFSGDTAGYPLWRAGMTAADPDTINGYPYVINQHMASGANAKAILFGDLSKYQIREVRDVQLVRLDELYAEYRQVVFLAWMRFDGDLLDAGTHPVKYLSMPS